MNFTPSDDQINAYRRIASPTISETVSKQTPLGIIFLLRRCADEVRAPCPYQTVRNIKPIDCDKLYEFLNAIADRLECLTGLREQKMKKKDEEIEMLKHGESDAFRNTPFGNAAAMREALMKIYKLTTADCPADEVEIANICFKALSAPPRNCDRLKTGEEAKYRFLQVAELPEGNGDADMREWYRKLIAWLFSPVGEGAAS